jgi:multiple antibiotic resistance protein
MNRWSTFGIAAVTLVALAGNVAFAADGLGPQNQALHATLTSVIGGSEIFTLFFITLGPLKTMGPFVMATRAADGALMRKIALAAFAISTISLFAGMFIGQKILEKWNVGLPALIITAGALLFFVAFRTLVVDLYAGTPKPTEDPAPPSMRTAISPLTFPVIATPYGIAILILLKAALPEQQITIFVALAGIMVLNLLAMLFARPVLRVGAMPLQLIGTILTVLQAALGVQMLISGFRVLAG